MKLLKNLFSGSTSKKENVDRKIKDDKYDRSYSILSELKYLVDNPSARFGYTNVYERFLTVLITAIDKIYETYESEIKYINQYYVLHRELYIKDCTVWFSKDLADFIYDQYKHTINTAFCLEPYRYIYEFAKFLIVADALLLYNNEDLENVYSIAETEDSIKLMIITDDFNIGYYFTRDIIKDRNRSILEGYVDNINPDPILGFVEVKRNNGSKTKTSFTFNMDGTHNSDSLKDDMLFNTIINNTISITYDTYTDIINRSVAVFTGNRDLKFDLMEWINGPWI